MSRPQDNLLDRLLKYSPWLAGALVGFCFLALVLRLSIHVTAGDREAIAAVPADAGIAQREPDLRDARQSTALVGRRSGRATDLEARQPERTTDEDVRRTDGATALEGRRTGRYVAKIQTPSAQSRLTVHHAHGESELEANIDAGGETAGVSNTSRPAVGSGAHLDSTPTPAVHSTASRRISGAPSSTVQGHTSFFGIEALGRRFAYVLDRSGSMGDPDNKPLAAAKRELLASLERLEGTHQFFLIFYNDEPAVFNPAGAGRQLVFADDLNKQQARRFVQSIQARGGTRHYGALSKAIALRPDVIFLLTDGEPKDDLLAEELARLTRSNGGIAQIHVVQFANAPYDGNSLAELARENRGQHTYKSLREIVSRREF